MKIKLFILLAFTVSVFSIQHANAKIFRVGYWGNQIPGQDYTTLLSAHDAAAPGDTILVFPGGYPTTVFSKRLVIIGYGYFVTGTGANINLQVITGAVSLDIRLTTGSDSTILEGLDGLVLYAQPGIPLKNVIIRRCIVAVRHTNALLTGWQITQCYITSVDGASGTGAVYKNLLVENCILAGLQLQETTSASTGIFANNIFGTGGVNFNNGGYTLSNNIFLSTTAPANIANCIFFNNIASNNTIPSGNGNQPAVNINNVFVGYPTQGIYSNDGRYALVAGSPAIHAGVGNIDCGIFGGTNPYRLSGIPPIPSFYKLTAPSNIATTNPYTITFSVKGNN